MTSTIFRIAAACAAAVLALGLAACGGTATTTPAAPAPSAAAPTAAADDDTDGTDGTDAAGAKVSANTASEDEIAAALATAGVSNPERWAEEVVEYRPYPTDDPDLTKLREDLAKYNPSQATTDKIVSALAP
jgi:hypothetical protein